MRQLVVIIATVLLVTSAWAYTPPIGIPDPVDGNWSAFGEIDQATPATATKCPNWPSAATEACYYIDNTADGNTDSGNAYGYPEKPRTTIPTLTDLAAGTFVYINDGNYSVDKTITGTGTAENPIWITGNSDHKPLLKNNVKVGYGTGSVSWLVVENLQFTTTSGKVLVGPNAEGVTIDHVLLRYLKFKSPGNVTDQTCISLGSDGDPVSTGYSTRHIVIYDNNMTNIGDYTLDSGESGGIGVSLGVTYLWILDNYIHYIQGADSIYGGHIALDEWKPNFGFIGRNDMGQTGENCIDLKGWANVVVSENTCSGPFYDEFGSAMNFQVSDGASPSHKSSNVWVVFNTIHTACMGIAIQDGTHESYAVGNLIYGMSSENGINCILPGGIILESDNSSWIVDNTIYDFEGYGIKEAMIQGDVDDDVQIYGNVISNRSGSGYEINITENGSEAYVNMDRNIFYIPSGSAAIFWANASHTLDQIKGHSECSNCIEADPLFTNPTTDFTLQSSSPAIGANTEHAVYDLFTTTWAALGFEGLSIKKDRAGTTRPQGAAWDIGAYEYLDTAPTASHFGGSGSFNMR